MLATLSLLSLITASPMASLYAEREALLAADARCALLAPEVRQAAAAGARQARGAMAREGAPADALDAVAQAAATAVAARPCEDPALQAAALAAHRGFQAWSRTFATSFPAGDWRARRSPDAEGWVLWRTGEAGGRFGLRLWPQGARLTWASAALLEASSARISLRAPNGEVRAWVAEARAPAAVAFPDAAAAAMAELEPGGRVEVQVIGRDGAIAARWRLDPGDFGAGVAFLAAGP